MDMKILKKLLKSKKTKTQIFGISLQNIQTTFENIVNEAKWDTKDKLFWGYYFLDHNLQKLEKFAEKLKEIGYQVLEIRTTNKDKLFLLHAEQYVSHNPQSLFDQFHKLANLAKANDIEVFDGWDVEKVKLDKGLAQ